jgi:hypothetical protein
MDAIHTHTHAHTHSPGNVHGRRVDLKVFAESIGWILTGAAVGLAAVVLVGMGIMSLDRKSAPAVVESVADSPLTAGSVPATDPISPGTKN